MKRLVSMITIAAVMSGAASAADFKTACTRGNDERIIEVVAPGEVGAACDVRYFRGSSRAATVPFHADNSENFCLQKANELINTLATSGYSCAAADSVDVAQAPPAPQPDTAELAAETQIAARDVTETVAPAPEIDTSPVVAPEAMELEDKMNEILSQPEQQAAVRGPADLTDQVVDTIDAGSTSPVVGRIVGATPDAPVVVAGIVTPVAQAALREDAVEAKPAVAAPVETNDEATFVKGPERTASSTPASLPTPTAEKLTAANALRSSEDVVRATLKAQAAAWNEGNLDAFMETYWKDDDLKFVSGAEITKGWSSTSKRYRELYSDGNGLGQLGLEEMDVELVTDDVAVVTGRFDHSKVGEASTSGIFSLVMKRDSGVWRIVHDHTVADAKPSE